MPTATLPIRLAQRARGKSRWEVTAATSDNALPAAGYQLAGPILRLDLLPSADGEELRQLLSRPSWDLVTHDQHRLAALLTACPRDPSYLPPLDLDPFAPTPADRPSRAQIEALAGSLTAACVQVGLGAPRWCATGGKGLHGHFQVPAGVPPHPDILRALLPLIRQAARIARAPILSEHRDLATRTPGVIYLDDTLWEKSAAGRGGVWALEGDTKGKHYLPSLGEGSPADANRLAARLLIQPLPQIPTESIPGIPTGPLKPGAYWRRLGSDPGDPACPGCGKLDGRSCRVKANGAAIRCHRLEKTFDLTPPAIVDVAADTGIDAFDRRRYFAAAAKLARDRAAARHDALTLGLKETRRKDADLQRASILGRASRCDTVWRALKCSLAGHPLTTISHHCQRPVCPDCAKSHVKQLAAWFRAHWEPGTYQVLVGRFPDSLGAKEIRRIARKGYRAICKFSGGAASARYHLAPRRLVVVSRDVAPIIAYAAAKKAGLELLEIEREALIEEVVAGITDRSDYLMGLLPDLALLAADSWAARVHTTAGTRGALPWPSRKTLSAWLKKQAEDAGRIKPLINPDGSLLCGCPAGTEIIQYLIRTDDGALLDSKTMSERPWSDGDIAKLLQHHDNHPSPCRPPP